MTTLVIVESPAKAKTLSRILGDAYTVEASYGHVRDLPERANDIPAKVKSESWARLGVNVDADFAPIYVIPQDKKKHIKRLKELVAKADEILLATDEDREGESISWHVVQILKPKVPVKRIVFHEITTEAIHEALRNPRDVDESLVRAQESRRILDRLFGYQLSPVLWRKVRSGLSAGRVQSVAVRLCVLRERDRQRFRPAGYWDAEAEFNENGQTFTARLVRLDDQRVANGSHFDPETGELKSRSKVKWVETREEIDTLISAWESPWKVTSVETKPLTRRAAPPFTTSSLQQEANRKLRFTARHTMRVAQRLYEGVDVNGDRVGLITYMRTDSLTLSNKALHDAELVIRDLYGDEYAAGPRRYKTKSKGAQEAHEAIRPTEISRRPERVAGVLSADELKLYELIWKRTVASQMADARLQRTVIEMTAAGAGVDAGIFSASGTTIQFPGFLRAYVEGSDDPAAEIADREVLLPQLEKGASCQPVRVDPKGRETSPPPRYTEASLVKKLEAEGIGRPSTYASIIETVQNRGYVKKHNGALAPTFTAFAVTKLLEEHFTDYVDTGFTARMEQSLDEIANGSLDWKAHLHDFYFGNDSEPGLQKRIETQQPNIDYPSLEIGQHPETGKPMIVKVGRFGPYLQTETADGERVSASLPDTIAPADLDSEHAVLLLAKAEQGSQCLGDDPETKLPIYLAHGRFGAYVQLGESLKKGSKGPRPKRASLPKGTNEEEVTLEAALLWLSLPRTLGIHPENDQEIVATTGRFGPYVKCGDETRSLTAEDDVYTVELPRAVELLAQPKASRRRRARKVLAEYGTDKEGANISLLEGPYGSYLTNGKVNASLPKGVDAAGLDPAEAARILAERGKAPRGRRKKK